MNHIDYAKQKLEDNIATIKKYIGGNNVMFLSLYASLVDCDISMEQHRDDAENFAFFYQTKCHLARQMETYCILNKDLLISPNPRHDKNYIRNDRKP